MKKRFFFLCVILNITIIKINAQISEGGIPLSFKYGLKNEHINTININNNNIKSYRIDTPLINSPIPIVGEIIPVNLSFKSLAQKTKLPNATLWRLRINFNNEVDYLMLICDSFYLPPNSKLFVYTNDTSDILGAFTEKNNNINNKLSIGLLKGNNIIIEYYKPNNISSKGSLNITSIGKIKNKIKTGFGSSGECMNNVLCAEFDEWCNQRRSVALIIMTTDVGVGYCTGSLITNERRDRRPYLLTAFHCIDLYPRDGKISTKEKALINDWLFVFNFQGEDCDNPIVEPSTSSSISGGIFKAAYKKSDFALLELNKKPPPDYNVYYNGWNNEQEKPSEGACIHHPGGDIKKISIVDKVSRPFLEAKHWKVKWDKGATEKGSSGSPLFDKDGYVVGQLHNGYSACDGDEQNNQPDFFGRFDKSWDHGDNSSERLRDWLNPNGDFSGNNTYYLNSISGNETCKNIWKFSNANDLHTSKNITFEDLSTLGTRMYDGVYNASNYIETGENVTIQADTEVRFEAGDEIILKPGFTALNGSNFTARIRDCERGCGNLKSTSKNEKMTFNTDNIDKKEYKRKSDTFNFKVEQQHYTNIYPNPNKGQFILELNNISGINSIYLINNIGRVLFLIQQPSKNTYYFNLSNNNKGLFLLKIICSEKTITKKIIVQ